MNALHIAVFGRFSRPKIFFKKKPDRQGRAGFGQFLGHGVGAMPHPSSYTAKSARATAWVGVCRWHSGTCPTNEAQSENELGGPST